MNRLDKLIELLDKHKRFCRENDFTAAEIKKLFEVEGKVEYIIQHFNPGDVWYTVSEKLITLEYAKKLKKDKESKFLSHKFRIIKRTTTEIIEE